MPASARLGSGVCCFPGWIAADLAGSPAGRRRCHHQNRVDIGGRLGCRLTGFGRRCTTIALFASSAPRRRGRKARRCRQPTTSQTGRRNTSSPGPPPLPSPPPTALRPPTDRAGGLTPPTQRRDSWKEPCCRQLPGKIRLNQEKAANKKYT